MPKIAVLADVHFDEYESFSAVRDENGMTPRLKACVNAFNYVLDYCYHNTISTLIIAGDLFDRKSQTSTFTLHTFRDKCLSRLEELDICIIKVAGNHDFIDKGNTRSLATIFSSLRFVDVTIPTITEIGSYEIAMVPDVEDPQKAFREIAIKLGNSVAPKYLIAHVGVAGARMTTSMKSTSNVSVVDLLPENYAKCFLGDYHMRQDLGSNTFYVGALLQKTFGEEENPQGFAVLDLATGQHLFVDLPVDFPVFRTISSKDQITDEDRSNYIRLRSDTPVSAKELEKTMDKLTEVGASKVVIDVPSKINIETRINFSECKSLLEQGEKYIDKVATEGYDQLRLKKLLADYLTASSS